MPPFFSIIIPTLNEEHYLPRILNNLWKQKVKNFEVIIVDGKSQDKTPQIASEFSKKLLIRFVTAKKPNLSNQKNLGGLTARGYYLIFLDADMLVSSTFTALAEKMVKSKNALIYVPYVTPVEKREYPDINMMFPLLNRLIEFSLTLNKPFSGGPSMIWERNVFNTIGGFDKIFGEDHQIIRKAHLWGIRAKFLAKLKVRFSLRRMKKEGRLRLFYHFIMSHLYLMFNDRFRNEVFTYQMGGQMYNKKSLQTAKKKTFFDPKTITENTKKFFKTILLED